MQPPNDDTGIPGLGPVSVPTFHDTDQETEAHNEVATIFEEITDTEILARFLERIRDAAKKARSTANIRTGRQCIIREVDELVWERNFPETPPPQIGEVYNSYRLAGEALGVGYNAISVASRRNMNSSLITIKGVTIEKL